MAVLKNGKLVGRVGNLVYREMNGRIIVQSRPRPRKGGFKLTSRNSNFAMAAKAASGLYRELKDFALNQTTRDLYNSIIRLLMDNPRVMEPAKKETNWSFIPESHLLPVEKKSNLETLLAGELVSEITNGKCRIEIPSVTVQNARGSRHQVWKDTSEYEITCTLLHYDFKMVSPWVVKRWTSERIRKTDVSEPIVFDYDLKDFKDFAISDGLLLMSVGLKLYASASSDSYLNHLGFNPFMVAGVWSKH